MGHAWPIFNKAWHIVNRHAPLDSTNRHSIILWTFFFCRNQKIDTHHNLFFYVSLSSFHLYCAEFRSSVCTLHNASSIGSFGYTGNSRFIFVVTCFSVHWCSFVLSFRRVSLMALWWFGFRWMLFHSRLKFFYIAD